MSIIVGLILSADMYEWVTNSTYECVTNYTIHPCVSAMIISADMIHADMLMSADIKNSMRLCHPAATE